MRTPNIVVTALTLLTSLVLPGCNNSPETQVKSLVTANLIDPGSAKFGSINPGSDSKHYCGTVNAKNRMGGFTGTQPFVVELTGTDKGIVNFVPDTPISAEFILLRHSGSDYARKKTKLREKCSAIDTWNQFCKPTFEIHHLCHVLLGGNSDEFLNKLFKLR